MSKLFNIRKTYSEKSFKSQIEEKGLTEDNAQLELDINESLWKRNGGNIVSRDEFSLTVSEADDSETITWTIEEIED